MNRTTTLICTLVLLFLLAFRLPGQNSHVCGVKPLEQSSMEVYLDELPDIRSRVNLRTNKELWIPLYFTVLRNDDGSEDIPHVQVVPFSDISIPDLIDSLNHVFTPAGIQFYQMGSVRYIDHTALRTLKVPYWKYAYVSSGLNIIIGGLEVGSLQGSANMPNKLPAKDNHTNTLWLRSADLLLSPTFIHELGHSFGLFHTFEGAGYYDNPANPMQDMPSGIKRFGDNPSRHAPNHLKRELVIRKGEKGSKYAHFSYNADIAGDFVEDTPAFCSARSKFNFPDGQNENCQSWKTMGDCNLGCVYDPDLCVYVGSYVDYNSDTLRNTDIMVRNFMSYTGSCRAEFTAGQYQRMAYYADHYRDRQYNQEGQRLIRGHVEYMNLGHRMNNVNVRLAHQNDGRHCNATTNRQGVFEAFVFDEKVDILYMNRLGNAQVERYEFEDWVSAIDENDIRLIMDHIRGVEKLNSYQQLAADVNGDNQITIMDANLLSRLIDGAITAFPNRLSPWVFIPKSRIEAAKKEFLQNPFLVKTVENVAPGATFEFAGRSEIVLSNNYLIFVGLKLGDVDGSQSELSKFIRPYEINTQSTTYFAPDNFVESIKSSSMDIVSNGSANSGKLHCFPNPTHSGLNIAFNSGENVKGKISIIEASGRVFSCIERVFRKGSNHITLSGNQLPSGVVQINVTTDNVSFSKKIVKMD